MPNRPRRNEQGISRRRQLVARREAAEAKHHQWHQAIETAIRRDWPNPVVVGGRALAVATEIVEAVLGSEEFLRRREKAIADTAKGDGVDHHPAPRFAANGPPSVPIERPRA